MAQSQHAVDIATGMVSRPSGRPETRPPASIGSNPRIGPTRICSTFQAVEKHRLFMTPSSKLFVSNDFELGATGSETEQDP